ncbi:hypothetical protein HWV62_14900 [Athelia sp. TMB]|nr:hypothetical protein HWV62_14900 [Athelia sp. TMB]
MPQVQIVGMHPNISIRPKDINRCFPNMVHRHENLWSKSYQAATKPNGAVASEPASQGINFRLRLETYESMWEEVEET